MREGMNPDFFITAPKSGSYIVRAQRDHIRKTAWESSRGQGLRELPKARSYIFYRISWVEYGKSWFSMYSLGKIRNVLCTLGWEDNIERVDFQYTTSKNDKYSCTVSLLTSKRNIIFIGWTSYLVTGIFIYCPLYFSFPH